MSSLSRNELLKQIQMLDFYAVELNLFLDTHPNNQQALQDYRFILQQSENLRRIYEEKYGPLLGFHKGLVTSNTWNWNDEPWPWENMREGKYVDL